MSRNGQRGDFRANGVGGTERLKRDALHQDAEYEVEPTTHTYTVLATARGALVDRMPKGKPSTAPAAASRARSTRTRAKSANVAAAMSLIS